MQIVPIDTGRSSTKLFTKESFPSIVGDWQERNLSKIGNYEVMIDGEKFFVGELAETESISPREMSTASKIHSETKILFLTALALTTTVSNPTIITGVPINQFKIETKEAMQNLLCGEYDVQVNEKQIHLSIKEINLVIEGGASFWYALSKNPDLKYGKKRIIDIGSRTINFCTVNNKNYNNRDSDTLDYGTLKMKEGKLTNEQFARKIVADLSQKWMEYDPKNDQILLSGGGALIFGNLLKAHFKNCEVIEDPLYANVLGFYRMGVEKWVKQQIAR